MGLLTPSGRTEAGYRLYSDTDLVRLEQILALKFLGLPLDEIKAVLRADPAELRVVLDQQRAMLRERRAHLDAVIAATEQAERLLQTDGSDWRALVEVIRAIQMSENNEWRNKYFTDEQLATMDELRRSSYSNEAEAALAARPALTEEDQRRVDEQYAALYAGVWRAVADGQDPAGVQGQTLAAHAIALLEAFTQANPAAEEGLNAWWKTYQALPAEQCPFQVPLSDSESAFLEAAKSTCCERRETGLSAS